MSYRNAFAHGKLLYESPTGCVLKYFSGKHKKFILDDEFWTKIEREYIQLEAILRDIVKAVREVN